MGYCFNTFQRMKLKNKERKNFEKNNRNRKYRVSRKISEYLLEHFRNGFRRMSKQII